MPDYTKLTNLEVTGHLKVAGQEVTPGGGGSSTLSGLTDVDISNPTNGQTLVYNATSGKWENGASGGGGLFIVGFAFDADTGKTTCDKTAQQIAQAIMGGSTVVLESTTPGYDVCSLRQILHFEYDNADPEDFYALMLTISGSGDVITWTIASADSYPFTQSIV